MAGDGERGAQRAQILAEEFAVHRRHQHQRQGVGHEGQLALEAQGDRRFERLHLGVASGIGHGLEEKPEKHQQDDVLDRQQPLVHQRRYTQLAQAESLGALVDQLLQCAEGTQPAAVHAPAPQQQGDRDEAPENERERLDQEGLPPELAHDGVDESQHVDDGELRERIPSDEHQGVDEESETQVGEQRRVPGEPVLQHQDECQHQQAHDQHADAHPARLPHVHPQGLRLGGLDEYRLGAARRAGLVAVAFASRQGHAPRLGDRACRSGDRCVEHHDGDGGAADAVHRDVAGARLAAHLEAVEDTAPRVLVHIALEVALGDADQEDRFLVREDLHPADAPGDVEAHQNADGLARVGWNAHHVVAEKDVAAQLVGAEHRRRRGGSRDLSDSVRFGEERQRERPGVGGQGRGPGRVEPHTGQEQRRHQGHAGACVQRFGSSDVSGHRFAGRLQGNGRSDV